MNIKISMDFCELSPFLLLVASFAVLFAIRRALLR